MTVGQVETLLELKPFGMSVDADGGRPLLLMKDQSGELTLPVPLTPLEAGVALTQSNKTVAPTTPHRVTELLLTKLGAKISRCVFQEIKLNHQYVALDLENFPSEAKALVVRADECMSLCLHLEVPVFASRDFILKSRTYVADLNGQYQNLLKNPKVLQRTHHYIM